MNFVLIRLQHFTPQILNNVDDNQLLQGVYYRVWISKCPEGFWRFEITFYHDMTRDCEHNRDSDKLYWES